MNRALALTVCSILLSACSADRGAVGVQSPHGASAPDFSLQDLEGKTVHLSDFTNGKNVVLIDFWSTTCDPCMTEMPHLVGLYKAKKDAGLVVLAVSVDGPESRAQVTAAAHDKEMIFPVLLDEETSVVAKYNPKGERPFTALIGKSGGIVFKHAGYAAGDEKLISAEVDKALAE